MAARVVPAVPSFSVDRGFWYSIPPSHLPRLSVGSLVRVPLGGRRVRGFVVEIARRNPDGLKPLASVSGDLAIFDPPLREALIWAAHHYVAPVAAMLDRAAPPNLASRPPSMQRPEHNRVAHTLHPLDAFVAAVAAGRRRPPTALLSPWGDWTWLAALEPILDSGRSILIVVATAAEVEIVASHAGERLAAERVVAVSGEMADAEATAGWSIAATSPGTVLVGTPRVAAWPVASPGLAVVVEDGRRAMKDRQTPTVSARSLVMTRARLEGFAQLYVGPTPSVELLASGVAVIPGGHRAWPLVEVVDRSEEPPGSGTVSPRVRAALASTIKKGGRAFVFTHRKGYAPAYRCASCREVRRCPVCGSRPEPGEACRRCGAPAGSCLSCGGESFEPLGAGAGRILAELRGSLGDAVGDAASDRPVRVGTERDLAGLAEVDLAVAVDADGLALGSHFRASEDALRVLARLAGRVRRGSGRRLMVQTSLPDHPLITALRRGDPVEFLTAELEHRRAMGYPPATEMMVVETRGEEATVAADLIGLADDTVMVMGPATTHDSTRWLVQGPGLGGLKLAMRPLVQRWRDAGAVVRIDVDPLDL